MRDHNERALSKQIRVTRRDGQHAAGTVAHKRGAAKPQMRRHSTHLSDGQQTAASGRDGGCQSALPPRRTATTIMMVTDSIYANKSAPTAQCLRRPCAHNVSDRDPLRDVITIHYAAKYICRLNMHNGQCIGAVHCYHLRNIVTRRMARRPDWFCNSLRRRDHCPKGNVKSASPPSKPFHVSSGSSAWMPRDSLMCTTASY